MPLVRLLDHPQNMEAAMLRPLVVFVVLATCFTGHAAAQGDTDTNIPDSVALRIDDLEMDLNRSDSQLASLKQTVKELEVKSGTGAVLFLFGTFCALWAQNTGRNAWLWFFLGLLFSIVTVLFLLSKNSADLAEQRRAKSVLDN